MRVGWVGLGWSSCLQEPHLSADKQPILTVAPEARLWKACAETSRAGLSWRACAWLAACCCCSALLCELHTDTHLNGVRRKLWISAEESGWAKNSTQCTSLLALLGRSSYWCDSTVTYSRGAASLPTRVASSTKYIWIHTYHHQRQTQPRALLYRISTQF